MNTTSVPRRQFLSSLGLGALALQPGLFGATPERPAYRGPNVILIRYGGGARRRESIDPRHTYSPFLCHELTKRGVLFTRMEIDQFRDLNTSHGEGTLYLLTGRYQKFRDVAESRPEIGRKFLGARFEATVPTLFEYLRDAFDVPEHQALLINGEDRADEEFYNFSNHHLFGVEYRSQTLSLRRYKMWLLAGELAGDKLTDSQRAKKAAALAELRELDYRADKEAGQGREVDGFWSRWQDYYGRTGLVNPRGDALLTELTVRALRQLRPRLLMVNYQDCDYVHWGYLDHYTRALSIMDRGIETIVREVENDPEYRNNTVFVVVPDCGRDDNPFMAVPCQHHFNTRSAHEIFALVFGRGVPRGVTVDRRVSQVQIAATIGRMMGFPTPHAETQALEEAWS
jgi:hypothetical protein